MGVRIDASKGADGKWIERRKAEFETKRGGRLARRRPVWIAGDGPGR